MTFHCHNRRYQSYGYIALRAQCSMAPYNCQYEVREAVKLQTGRIVTMYYCVFKPETQDDKQCRK